jgi:peroxiredoxin
VVQAKTRVNIRPFHIAVVIVFASLLLASGGYEFWRRRNPAETLFTDAIPAGANAGFRVRNPAGREQEFLSFLIRGPVLLYVWNTSCTSCIDEMRLLNQLVDTLPQQTVRVLTVATDADIDTIRRFLSNNQFTRLEAYSDADESLKKALKLQDTPRRYLINQQGTIVGMSETAVPWMDERVIVALQNISSR